MAKFSFQVGEAKREEGSGALSRPFWVYTVVCKTDHEQYNCKELQVQRRYSDFEWFRNQLSNLYPFCIIPPIPEKDINGTVDKFMQTAANKPLLEYRQRALRKFLSRVGAHPYLQNSDVLRNFLEQDREGWSRYMRDTPDQQIASVLPRFAAVATSAVEQQWNPTAVPRGGDASQQQAYSQAISTAELPSDASVWEDTKHYIGQLEESVKTLRERIDHLVRRRRGTSTALGDFGRNFQAVGQIEAQLDSNGEASLSRAANAVGRHAQELATIYNEHASQENNTVVEALQYYVGVCAAAKETLKRLQGVMATRDSLKKSHGTAVENREKLVGKGAPSDKVVSAEDEVKRVNEHLEQAKKQVGIFEANFREELRRFHREKQFDMKEILRQFVMLQRDYSDKMKRSWDDLIPTVEDVRTE
jgi:hypothetical protein